MPILYPEDDLETALQKANEAGSSEGVVVSANGDGAARVGILRREGALEAWRSSTVA